jgi:thiol-disulfide isomerase/thioredoxin
MPSTSTAVFVLAALFVVTAAAGWVWRSRNGRIRQQSGQQLLSASDLGLALGERATLVQFSSAFCQPCRATRAILSDVSAQLDGVAHVDIDAESHLDLVRRLEVMRTPTVLVLDGAGRIVKRASGAPRKADVLAALGPLS